MLSRPLGGDRLLRRTLDDVIKSPVREQLAEANAARLEVSRKQIRAPAGRQAPLTNLTEQNGEFVIDACPQLGRIEG